jgi:ElaB/YqjD/DUF883 family membrane-anchored ribosome-binding protein
MASESNGIGPDIDSIRRDVEALKDDVKKLVGDIRSTTSQRAEQLYGSIREDGPEAVREHVRDRPIASLGLAFLAGVVLAGILRR